MKTTLIADTFVLVDSKGNFVNSNAIRYNNVSDIYTYSYSKVLTNGPFTYQSELDAKVDLELLREYSAKIKFSMEFHIEGIIKDDVILKESKVNDFEVGFCPFKTVKIIDGLAMVA